VTSTATSAIANHPATVAVHQAVVEPYCTGNVNVFIIIIIIIIITLAPP